MTWRCALCRSDLTSADAEQADEKEDDFVKGFKVANFEIIDSPDKGASRPQCKPCIRLPSRPLP